MSKNMYQKREERKNKPIEDKPTSTSINWYPGHMTKAKRMMEENVKLVDLIIEVVDARIPRASRNPDIDRLGAGKSRLIIMNKADLADSRANKDWESFFSEKGFAVVQANSKAGVGIKSIGPKVREACKEKIERNQRKGIINRPIRAMVVGIPNVGKSTFINAYAGRACTKTGNKPGVTKGKQWIHISNELELLDTPGILWPKFEDKLVGMNLALVGSINDEILNLDDLAFELIKIYQKRYPKLLEERYVLDGVSGKETLSVLDEICELRKCYKRGNEPDYSKICRIILDDFRSGKLGKITLELPPEKK